MRRTVPLFALLSVVAVLLACSSARRQSPNGESASNNTTSANASVATPTGNANTATVVSNANTSAPINRRARRRRASETSATPTTTTSPDVAKIVQDKVNKLEEGQLLYNLPQEMRVGIKERVEARIAKEITDEVREGIKGGGETTIEEIKIDTFMRVRLTGGNFDIEPVTGEEEQPVVGDQYGNWSWDVTPESSGNQTLFINVSVKANIPDRGEKVIWARVFEKPINVRVHPIYSTTYFCKKNYQWLLGTIVSTGAVGGVVGFTFGRRAKKQQPPGAS